MPCLKPVSSAALVLALSAPAALADVTGAQVWSDWKIYMQSFGYEMAGTETQSGNVLSVTDITMTFVLPEDEGTMAMTMGALSFTDNSNGTVSVDLPEEMPLTFDMTPAEGEAASGTLLLKQDAPVMIVSGDPGDFTYTYSSNNISMTLTDLVAEGDEIDSETLSMMMALTDVSSTTRSTVGDLRSYDGSFSAAGLTYDIAFNVTEGPDQGSGNFKGAMNNVSITGGGKFPEGVDSSDMAAMIAAGTEVTSTMRYESGSSDVQAEGPDGPFAATTSSTGGSLGIEMDGRGLRYDIRNTGVVMNAQVPDFPLPVSLTMAETAFSLGMPVVVSQDPQAFNFGITLGDFTISDTIWGLFDPTGQLPRDPATIALELSGTARVLSDIFDPMAMAMGGTPGELNSLAIKTLLVDVIGARLSGEGAFTFDNTDLVTFDGMPRPEGALDLRLEGANALIDTLVGMGLLPQEQAMGARMMMGLFGVPQGEDTLTSKIEVNAEGHVLANGQRLQ